MNPVISVITPVYNQSHLTRRCIESLLEGSKLDTELIVIDNASADDTPEVLEKLRPKALARGWDFQVIRNRKNVGFGRAMNQGIAVARGSFVALLNNDTWLMPGWDAELSRRLVELGASMVSPYFDETPFEEGQMRPRAKRCVRKNRRRVLRQFCPIVMLFSREALGRIGLFDERFFLTYEDTDLHWRMDRMKEKYFTVGNCYIWHHSKGTRGSMPSSHEVEGKRLFIEKWGFDPTLWEHTLLGRLKRRWQKIRRRFGYL